MYAEENCKGKVTRWQPHLNYLPDPLHHWDGDTTTNFMLRSMSPCIDKCDPHYWQGSEAVTEVNLTLYNTARFNGDCSLNYLMSQIQYDIVSFYRKRD